MINIFIIHGAYGNPEENWIPWLKSELENLGCRVFVPKFPTPDNQNLENWASVFSEYKKYLETDSIMVGHSIGSAFILNIIERIDKPIKAALFVSGFIDFLNNPDFDEINKSFVDRKFNWDIIKKNCRKFYVFHSDNDPYVPIEKAENLAKRLGVDITLVKNAGHFNKNAGYIKFDLLLEKTKKEL